MQRAMAPILPRPPTETSLSRRIPRRHAPRFRPRGLGYHGRPGTASSWRPTSHCCATEGRPSLSSRSRPRGPRRVRRRICDRVSDRVEVLPWFLLPDAEALRPATWTLVHHRRPRRPEVALRAWPSRGQIVAVGRCDLVKPGGQVAINRGPPQGRGIQALLLEHLAQAGRKRGVDASSPRCPTNPVIRLPRRRLPRRERVTRGCSAGFIDPTDTAIRRDDEPASTAPGPPRSKFFTPVGRGDRRQPPGDDQPGARPTWSPATSPGGYTP